MTATKTRPKKPRYRTVGEILETLPVGTDWRTATGEQKNTLLELLGELIANEHASGAITWSIAIEDYLRAIRGQQLAPAVPQIRDGLQAAVFGRELIELRGDTCEGDRKEATEAYSKAESRLRDAQEKFDSASAALSHATRIVEQVATARLALSSQDPAMVSAWDNYRRLQGEDSDE